MFVHVHVWVRERDRGIYERVCVRPRPILSTQCPCCMCARVSRLVFNQTLSAFQLECLRVMYSITYLTHTYSFRFISFRSVMYRSPHLRSQTIYMRRRKIHKIASVCVVIVQKLKWLFLFAFVYIFASWFSDIFRPFLLLLFAVCLFVCFACELQSCSRLGVWQHIWKWICKIERCSYGSHNSTACRQILGVWINS